MKPTSYLMVILLLLTACTGCDDNKLKPGEFEDPAFAKCVQDKIDYAANLGLLDKKDPELYNKIYSLGCSGGTIKRLDGIENMPNLEDVDIVDNQIESLGPLRTLTKLKFLKLNNNKIEDLEPLSELKELSSLYLINNYVSDIKPLFGLSKLYIVSLAGNCITDLQQFEDIRAAIPNINLGTPEDEQTPEKCQ